MSGFSPELIDYLEGKISFEEFERRREERKSREKVSVLRLTGPAAPPAMAAPRGPGSARVCEGDCVKCRCYSCWLLSLNICAKMPRS